MPEWQSQGDYAHATVHAEGTCAKAAVACAAATTTSLSQEVSASTALLVGANIWSYTSVQQS